MEAFALAELRLGPGLLGLCPMPVGAAALARLRAWCPDLVLSLTPLPELVHYGAEGLPGALRQAGIGWRHFPIADFDTPGSGASWPAASAPLHAILAGGGRLAIHCRAGCGRTGMIALRLMVEAGEPPQTALHRLRAARPCAVETGAQRAWAMAPTG